MRLNCVGAAAVALTTLVAGLVVAAPMEGNPKNGLSSAALRRNTLTTNKRSLHSLLEHPIKLAANDTLFRQILADAGVDVVNGQAVLRAGVTNGQRGDNDRNPRKRADPANHRVAGLRRFSARRSDRLGFVSPDPAR